ncbi:3616_t:CDS:1, partial [Cetraspora pellucida]
IINKRRATASITKEDLNEYFTEAIKLKWTIDYQDSTDQIATLINKAKTYYNWSKIIKEKSIRNYNYISIEYKSRVIYHYELISLKPILIEIYNPKEVDEQQ